MIAHETFWGLLTDLNHWGLEVVTEAAFFAVEVVLLDKLLHWHHAGRHGMAR